MMTRGATYGRCGSFAATSWLSCCGVAVCLLVGVGCAGPAIHPTDHLAGPGVDEPFLDGSMARWGADFNRVIYDIPRAVKRSHWGLLHAQPDGPDEPGVTPDGVSSTGRVVRARALLPDGRTATIIAWSADEGAIAVVVRVGRFGDRPMERVFISELAQVLRGKPGRRQRVDAITPKPWP